MRTARYTALVLMLLLAVAAAADQATLLKVAPDTLLRGWSPVKDTTVYGSGNDITRIYNGGYEVYTKAGVTEALRRLYSRKADYAEVTVHRMKTPKAAAAFLADRYKMETRKKLGAGVTRFSTSGSGSTTAYAIAGVWYLTVVTYDSSAKARQDASELRAALEAKARKVK